MKIRNIVLDSASTQASMDSDEFEISQKGTLSFSLLNGSNEEKPVAGSSSDLGLGLPGPASRRGQRFGLPEKAPTVGSG